VLQLWRKGRLFAGEHVHWASRTLAAKIRMAADCLQGRLMNAHSVLDEVEQQGGVRQPVNERCSGCIPDPETIRR
jgi:hypothetical protein